MLLDAIEVGHRLGDRSVEGQAAFHLGRLHAQAGNADSARRYLNRAARVWQLVGNDSKVAAPVQQLGRTGRRPGRRLTAADRR